MCGIALTAECIFFVSDPHGLYPLLEATENDDIYAAAWIGIFVGFALLALSILGIIGVMKSNKTLLLVVSVAMFARWFLPNLKNIGLFTLFVLVFTNRVKTAFIGEKKPKVLLLSGCVLPQGDNCEDTCMRSSETRVGELIAITTMAITTMKV